MKAGVSRKAPRNGSSLRTRERDLDAIAIEMLEVQNGVRVTATNLREVNGVRVDVGATLAVTPRPRIEVGAGDIRLRRAGPDTASTSLAAAHGSGRSGASLHDRQETEVFS